MGDCQRVPLTKLGALKVDLDFPRMIERHFPIIYLFISPRRYLSMWWYESPSHEWYSSRQEICAWKKTQRMEPEMICTVEGNSFIMTYLKSGIIRKTIKVLTLYSTVLKSMAGEIVCNGYVYHMWKLRWAWWGRLPLNPDLISQSSHDLPLGRALGLSRLFARCLVHPFIMREKSLVPNPSGWWSDVPSLDHLLRRTYASNSDPFSVKFPNLEAPTQAVRFNPLNRSYCYTDSLSLQV